MRKIQTKDVFKLARIIKVAGLKDVIKDITKKAAELQKDDEQNSETVKDKEKATEELGFDVILAVVESCCSTGTEQMLYELFDDITGKQFETLELPELLSTMRQIAKDNDLATFFNSASRLIH